MALTVRLNKEEGLDHLVMNVLSEKKKNHLKLLINSERSFFIKKRQLVKHAKKEPGSQKSLPTKMIDTRDLGSSHSASKLSLAVFTKPLDEMTKQKTIKRLDQIFSDVYGDIYSRQILNELIDACKKQQIKHISQLDLKHEKLQKAYFKMLSFKGCPLDHLITLEPHESKALFHFFYLRKDLFQKMFPALLNTEFFVKELELQKKFRSHIVPKDQIKQLLLVSDENFSQVELDQLVSFKSPETSSLKPSCHKDQQLFFYLPKD